MVESTRVALVTGGSGGIGRDTSERLARDGRAVAVHYAGNKARADEAVEEIISAGGRAMAAAKAAEDSLAVSYSAELARFGIDTVIILPGAFTSGTNHFAHAGHPEDDAVARAYEARYGGLMDRVGESLAELEPDDADPHEVAAQIARVVDLPKGQRPFRVHVDPSDDGASTVNAVGDEIRARFYYRIGLTDLLSPAARNPNNTRG